MIETERLILRDWTPEDLEPFAALNADPRVREFFPGVQTREESDESATRFMAHAKAGLGPWAVEVKGGAKFVGFCGIWKPLWPAPFTPREEIGWRLAFEAWGKGYAQEAARASVAHGFASGLPEIVSITVPKNVRSRRVMEAIGMTHDPNGDFDHPSIAEGHPLRRHVLYRIKRG